MTSRVVLFVIALSALAGVARAADLEAGKVKAQTCAACHGANGISRTSNVPSLAGQPDPFLEWQLVYFRIGARKNELMSPIAEPLSNDDVQNLSAYLASLPPPMPAPASPADAALMAAGAKIAARHRCASCHQHDFSGLDQAARLAGQREEYLLKALRDFKSGARHGGGVAAMPEIAFALNDDDMKAVAYYLAHAP
jgi:cytochrome c553